MKVCCRLRVPVRDIENVSIFDVIVCVGFVKEGVNVEGTEGVCVMDGVGDNENVSVVVSVERVSVPDVVSVSGNEVVRLDLTVSDTVEDVVDITVYVGVIVLRFLTRASVLVAVGVVTRCIVCVVVGEK